jgi:hypothetical protein
MKTPTITGVLLMTLMVAGGCTDREAEAKRAREEAEAKARADAARKEMNALPKAFPSRDYFKKNELTPNPAPAPANPDKK